MKRALSVVFLFVLFNFLSVAQSRAVISPVCIGYCYGSDSSSYELGKTCWKKSQPTLCQKCVQDTANDARFSQVDSSLCGVPISTNAIICGKNNAVDCGAVGGKYCGQVWAGGVLQNVNRCFPPGSNVTCVTGTSASYINAQIDYACGLRTSPPAAPANPPPSDPTTPQQPTSGACDGCMDEGSCGMRRGSWTKQTSGTCAPQGGYCSGTTFCGGGSSSTPAPLNRACGEKCSSNSDCRNPSGNGSPVACVNGTCQNTMCPAGQTIPGGNCSCGSNTRKCGQTCNGTVGLCGPGQGSCTYVNSPQHWYTGQPDCAWGSSTYCANSKNGYSTPVCITGDTPGGRYLVAPNGATRGITVEQMKASCQVCGNGEVEIGEECDLGANNGKSGFDCTANTCKKVSCNKVCATSADCGAVQHTVKLVALSRTSTSDILIDYVLDGTTYADTTPTLLPAGGLWTTVTSTDAHGGSYLRTAANGANVTYKTYSSSIVLHTQGGSARGSIAVYVDNVLKTTISNLTTQTGWVDVPVLVSLANQYTCYGAGTAKTCRLSANPSDSACTPPPPTATPVPTPVALVCSMPVSFTSTGNKAAWKIGDKITFTVGSVAAASLPTGSTIRYEGQVNAYRGTKQAYAATLSPINATASQFAPITIEAVNATYYFRFRYCLKNFQSVESCSAWGAWGSPIGN